MKGLIPANPVVCGLKGGELAEIGEVAPVVPVGWLGNVEVEVNCEASEGVPVVSLPGLFESSDQFLLKVKEEATLPMPAPSVEPAPC